MKRTSLLLTVSCFFLLGTGVEVFSQSGNENPLGKVSISSPNAAALGKYGDYTVGYQTGTPQISIPIYTVKDGPISLPVSLSYHASGLKVMEPASSVGAGWSLNAGGVITRTVRGNVDERGFGAISNQTHGHLSDYGYNSYAFIDATPEYGCDLTTPGNKIPDDARFSDGKKDGEPDLFTFNFGGYSGKFFFNDDRTPVIVPEQDLKIETNPIVSPYTITTFIITTPDGVKYYFGQNQTPGNGGVDAVEVTSSCDAQVGLNYGSAYSSWYLVKVVSPDNLFSISLKYEEEKYSSYTISMKPLDGYEIIEKEFTLVKNYMKGVRIAKISTSTSEITFTPGALRQDLSNFNPSYNSMGDDPNTEAKTVGEIQVQNTSGNGTNCKKYKFTYSYFEDNVTPFPNVLFNLPTTSDKKRLKLDKIQEYSCDETKSVPPYLFNYHTELVPRQISFGQDHWGFYNGVSTNTTLIPTYTENTYTYKMGANREAKWPEMRGGALNKITYPTGGSTDFEFEPNTTWVNATVYSLVQTGYYGVGYNQNNTALYPNINFTANHYRVTITNNNCSAPYSYCPAAVYLESNDGNISYGQIVMAQGGESASGVVVAPAPGLYRLRLHRDNSTQNGVGATAVFEEIVPSQLQSNVTVGGLRIKKIISHDAIAAANDVTTEYRYDDQNNKSNGILYSKPVYVGVIRNDIIKQVGINGTYPHCSPNGCVSCLSPGYYKSPTSLRPMETLQGGHVGYNEVKTFQTGKGSSVYRFYGSDIWDLNTSDVCTRNVNISCDLTVPNYPAAPLPFEYKRGELKYEGHFNESGQLLKYSWYYPVFADNPLRTPGTSRGTLYTVSTLTNYEITTKRKTQMTVDETMVNPLTGTTLTTSSTTYYESPWHQQATRMTSTNSKGETTEAKYKYAFDFRATGCDAMPDCWQTYNTAATAALNTYNYQLATCVNSGSCNCRRQAFHQYRRDLSEARISYVNCQLTNKTNFSNCFTNAKNAANTDLKPILELQSKNINTPIEVTNWKNGNLLSASFTKYDYSTSIPGMIYPAKAQRINLGSPSATFAAATVNGSGLTKDSRYEDEATVKIENGNIAEVLAKDGITTSYIWSYNYTLPVAKATGVNYTTLKAAYDAVGGNLDLLRSQPSLSNAFINTYVYTPGVGMTKETDPRGRNLYYEYDKLNRLVLIRDHDNNIIKKICYNYAGQPEDCNSPCTITTPNWQNTTTALRCQLNGSSQNTGYQEQEQKDMNPCSPTYNQLQWIVAGYNTTACPLPAGCNSGNCSGNDKKCINGVCETGTWQVISSYRLLKSGPWTCVYAYCFSDGTYSTYSENVSSSTMCPITCYW
ncbi:MAG: hypothetical protein ABL876_05940 [Chitinophagaceae bacterium]